MRLRVRLWSRLWFSVGLAALLGACGGEDCQETSCGEGTERAYLSCVAGDDFVVRDAETRDEYSRCTTDYTDPLTGMKGSTDHSGCVDAHARSKVAFCAGAEQPDDGDDGADDDGADDDGGTGGGTSTDSPCEEDGEICSCPNASPAQNKVVVEACEPTGERICCISPSYCKCGEESYPGSGCMFFGGINEEATPVERCTEAP